MTWTNLKIAYRNLLWNKSFSLINILGLTIGISSCILISLFVYDESQYGKDHPQKDQIYRVLRGRSYDMSSITSAKLLPVLKENIAGIEDGIRVQRSSGVISYKENRYNESALIYADKNFLEFFKWELEEGNKLKALEDENSIVLTREMALKYFGNERALGKVLILDNKVNLLVSGILKESKQHHPIQLDFIVNIETLKKTNPSALTNWDNCSSHTYVFLEKNSNAEQMALQIPTLIGHVRGYEEAEKVDYRLQAYPDIYLKSVGIGYDFYIRGDINVVRTFMAIAILILLLACFNYMNLSTAQSARRAREIGLRKTIGAIRSKLIVQFLIEAFILCLISIILSLILVEILLPWFNNLTTKNLSLYHLDYLILVPLLFIFLLFITFIAGFYPSFILSGFEPIKVLKGGNMAQMGILKKGKIKFKQVIVILQLACSVGLIIGSILIHEQLRYARNQDLGHQPEQLIVLNNIWSDGMLQRFNNVKTDLEQFPSIVKVTGAYNIPGENINNWSRFYLVGGDQEANLHAAYVGVEKDFFKVLGAEILKGRDFIDNKINEENNSCIINEEAAKLFGLTGSPIGQKITGFWDDHDRIIVGVVNNIHNKSLHETPPAVVYRIAETSYPYYFLRILIRVHPEKIGETVAKIENVWTKHAPEWPIQMRFISEEFENMYLSEKKVSMLMSLFTFLAIYISLSGLFGLIAFMAVTRRKEISIRKTLGASVMRIVFEMGKEFMFLTLIANIISWPIIYFASLRWLERFAESISINLLWYPFSGMIVLILVMLIVVYHSVHSANQNPVDALKYE